MKDNLILTGVVLGIVAVIVGLCVGSMALKFKISKTRIEKTGIEVIETTKMGRPTKVVTMTGDTCVVVPGVSLVKISK